MPKHAKLNISKGPAGWCLNVGATISESGKRQRLFFQSREKALAERRRRQDTLITYGRDSAQLKPSQAEDAIRAIAILQRHGCTLTEAAQAFSDAKDAREVSVTLAESFALAIKHREGTLRPESLAEFKRISKRFPDWILAKNLADLTKSDIERAIEETSPHQSVRWSLFVRIKATLNDAMKDGFLNVNPALKCRVQKPALPPPVIFEKWEDCAKVFEIAEEIHPDALPAFAVLAFAGVRSAELARLTWADVSIENRNIRIPASKSKTHTLRNVHVEDNLLAWLERYGKESGPIVPKGWKAKRTAVRKAAGIAGDADIFRHSYGSYFLAAFGDQSALHSNMGHQHAATYFKHYHRSITKRAALGYWAIAPAGVKIKTVREVA